MLIRVCWAVLAVIHALPALALLRPGLIQTLYGVRPGSDSFLLLQHRAALFLVIVIVCLWAMLRAEVRPLAAAAVGISMVSFLLLYWIGGAPPALRGIAIADLIGLPFLCFAAARAARLL